LKRSVAQSENRDPVNYHDLCSLEISQPGPFDQ